MQGYGKINTHTSERHDNKSKNTQLYSPKMALVIKWHTSCQILCYFTMGCGETERAHCHLLVHYPTPGRGEPNPDLPHGWQGPNSLQHHHCLPRSSLPGSWSQKPEPGTKPICTLQIVQTKLRHTSRAILLTEQDTVNSFPGPYVATWWHVYVHIAIYGGSTVRLTSPFL